MPSLRNHRWTLMGRAYSRLLSGRPVSSGRARGDRRCARNSAARTLVLCLSKHEPGRSQQPAQRPASGAWRLERGACAPHFARARCEGGTGERTYRTCAPKASVVSPWPLWFTALAVGVGVLLCRAGTAHAQPRPPGMSMTIEYGDETGLTLREVVTKGLRGLAQEYLTPAGMQQGEQEHSGAQPRGVQFELFTPGDVGVTVRYRW